MVEPKRVGGEGPLDAKIVIIGEAPGEHEERLGRPFVGPAGTLLNKVLAEVGIDRTQCYVTNVVKVRPPANKIPRLGEIGVDLSTCEEELHEELSSLKPNVIVPLGNTALTALTGNTRIHDWRGSILKYIGCNPPKASAMHSTRKVIPTLHPAALLRNMSDLPLFQADLQKVKIESESPGFENIMEREYITAPTFEVVMDYLEELMSNDQPIGLDIETDMGANIIYCVGLASSVTRAIVIPFYTTGPYWSESQEVAIWQKLREVLCLSSVKKVIQNEHFEKTVLEPWIGTISPVWMDTMVAFHILHPEFKKALKLQISLYTNEPFYKDDAKNANYEATALWKYNGQDCCVMLEIAFKLEAELRELNLWEFFYEFQMPFSHIMWEASHKGILVNQQRVKELRDKVKAETAELTEELNTLLGYEINVNSPKQIADLVYNKLKLPKRISRTTGNLTTNEEALVKLYQKHPVPALQIILKLRQLKKMTSTYLKKSWDEDGRIHPSWRTTAAVTGRIGCSKNIRKTGLPLMGMPKDKRENIRDIIVADPGHSLVAPDLSQVEARIVAYLSEDPRMIKVFEDGDDIHAMVASWLYKKPMSECGKGTIERNRAKACVHAGNYDIGKNKFAFIADIPAKDAEWLLMQYKTIFNIKQWHEQVIAQLRKNRTLITPLGRRRTFYGWWGDDLFRTAYAHVPQSTAVDHLNMGAVSIARQLPREAQILMQVHDELVIQCKDENIKLVSEICTTTLTKPLTIKGRNLVIPVNIEVGKNWKDMKEVK